MSLDYNALEVSREIDLSEVARFLKQSRLPHRISWQDNQQIVWVENEAAAEAVRQVFERFLKNELPSVDVRVGANTIRWRQILSIVVSSPLTMTILLANAICFPVTRELLGNGLPGEWLPLLTLTDFITMGGQFRFADLTHTIESGQWWRFVTPMLLHFGWLHLVFNLLWVWEFGRRIEILSGPLLLLSLVMVSAVSANLLQFSMSGVGLFGGMSGVVFGLMGFALVWDKRLPEQTHGIAPGIYIFMLVYLVLGFTGAVDLLGFGNLANGAHLGGLIAGLIVGLIASQLRVMKQP